MWRIGGLILSLLVLVVTGVLGIYNGLAERGDGQTALQHSVTVGVLLYGAFGLVSAYGLFRRQRWAVWTVVAWAVAVTYVAGVAVMAYAGEDAVLGSAIAASAGSALIAIGVLWSTKVITRAKVSTVAET